MNVDRPWYRSRETAKTLQPGRAHTCWGYLYCQQLFSETPKHRHEWERHGCVACLHFRYYCHAARLLFRARKVYSHAQQLTIGLFFMRPRLPKDIYTCICEPLQTKKEKDCLASVGVGFVRHCFGELWQMCMCNRKKEQNWKVVFYSCAPPHSGHCGLVHAPRKKALKQPRERALWNGSGKTHTGATILCVIFCDIYIYISIHFVSKVSKPSTSLAQASSFPCAWKGFAHFGALNKE